MKEEEERIHAIQLADGLKKFKQLFSEPKPLKSYLIAELQTMRVEELKSLLAYLYTRSDKRTEKMKSFMEVIRKIKTSKERSASIKQAVEDKEQHDQYEQSRIDDARGSSSLPSAPYDLRNTADMPDR